LKNKYLIVDSSALPEVFFKVVQAKEILKTGLAKDITEAVKIVGISRSSFYKYKDCVFSVSDGMTNHKVTISLMLKHKPGTLSSILNTIAQNQGNVLTINQDIPINDAASVTITFDALKLTNDINNLIKDIQNMHNVLKVELLAME
jgi:chorismate mutase